MAASASPTAHLLRTSRLFSLPPPLKKATHTTSISSTIAAFSPNATLPYPSLAALETTPACLAKGDWGLKRPLPLKSTANTTTPIIRVSAVDTIDHITDFESATDHVLSLRKWQEMNLPIGVSTPSNSTLSSKDANQPFRSVFDPNYDRIRKQAPGDSTSTRWKFKGPWLAGQTEGEFQDYVKRILRRKRAEFRVFIKPWIESILDRDNAEEAQTLGKDKPPPVVLSEKDFEEALVELRHMPNRLYEAIWEFLDLPGSPPKLGSESNSSKSDFANYMTPSSVDQAPPATHPAAGISYLRTSSHLPNHPVLGPQASQRPVQGRVLRAKNASTNRNSGKPAIGVGGFVSVDTDNTTFRDMRDYGWNNLDPDVSGGSKVYVFPQMASVNPRGRLKFKVQEANANQIAIWEGQYDRRWAFAGLARERPDKQFTMGDLINAGPHALSPKEMGQESVEKRPEEQRRARLPARQPGSNKDTSTLNLLNQLTRHR